MPIALRVLLAAFLIAAASCARERDGRPPEVIGVVDGDTIRLRIGPTSETVRLLGIDTPESVDPRRPLQCWGIEATRALERMLPKGTAVVVSRDIEARDRFGRLLAYVHRAEDGLFVNLEMLAAGHADVSIYEPNDAHAAAFDHAASGARTAARGLWGACDGPDQPVDPPWPQP